MKKAFLLLLTFGFAGSPQPPTRTSERAPMSFAILKRAFKLAFVMLAAAVLFSPKVQEANAAFRAASSGSGVGTSIVTTLPAGTASSDVVVAVMQVGKGSPTITPPAGWTAVAGPTNFDFVTQRFWAPGSVTNLTFTVSPSVGFVWTLIALSGRVTTSPVDTSAGTSGTGSTATAPSITVATGSDLICDWMQDGSSSVFGPISDATIIERSNLTPTGVSLRASTGSKDNLSAGATGTPSRSTSGGDWITGCLSIKAAPVSDASYVVANAQSGQVNVYWSSANPVVILRKTGSVFTTEGPANGTTYSVGNTGGSLGTAVVQYVGSTSPFNQGSLTNGTTYYYKVFANASSSYSPGIAINATPAATSPAWTYGTTASSLAPPALDPWSNKVVVGSNDNKLHAMNEANGTLAFAPFVTGQPIQTRPAMVPAAYRTPTTTVNIAYVTSQDGFVYAVDTSAGTQVWQSPSLAASGMLQGGAGVWIQGIAALSICGVNSDVVFVGTRNTASTSLNKVYALNGGNTTVTTNSSGTCTNTSVAPGGILWTYAGSGTSPCATCVDIISSTPYVDYVNNVVWVTSRAAAGTSQPSLWKINASNGTLATGTATWNLNDIDSSPVPSLSADGNYIYVGTNGGKLQALKVNTGTATAYTPATGTGAVVGMPWNLSYRPVGSGAAIAFVNTANARANGATSCAPVLASATAGNTNVVVVAIQTTTSTVSSVSDTTSTYIRRAAINGTSARIELWTATIASSASATVTVTLSASSNVACAVGQYSGAGIGYTNTVTGSSGNPSMSLTTEEANNWVVSGFATFESASTAPTAGTGTLRTSRATSSGFEGVGLVDNTNASPTSVTVSETAANSGWAGAAVELRTTTSDTIIFTQGTYVQSVNWNGSTFTANWTGKQLTGTPTLSAPVDDGAGNLYIGGSDGKVHRVLVSNGSDAAQVPTTAISGTFGDPTFNYDLNKIVVGATDGHIYTFATGF